MTLKELRKILNLHNVDNNIINGRMIAYTPVLNVNTGTWSTSRDDVTDYTREQIFEYLGY